MCILGFPHGAEKALFAKSVPQRMVGPRPFTTSYNKLTSSKQGSGERFLVRHQTRRARDITPPVIELYDEVDGHVVRAIRSIEMEGVSQQYTPPEEEIPCSAAHPIPIIIDEGVLVGFWFADATGRGRQPVYCLVKRHFEYAYRKGKSFVLVRWIDFDPLDILGDWMGDDTEHDEYMSPERVKDWVVTMWMSRKYIQDLTVED